MMNLEEYLKYGTYLCNYYKCNSKCPFIEENFCVFPEGSTQNISFNFETALKILEDFKIKILEENNVNSFLTDLERKFPYLSDEVCDTICPKEFYGENQYSTLKCDYNKHYCKKEKSCRVCWFKPQDDSYMPEEVDKIFE